jgi:hypothetical protein
MIKDLEPQSDTLISRLRTENISQRILTIRGHRVMLDANLAALYDVPTKAFNQAIQRNMDRFPEDFMFQLTEEEFAGLRSQFVTSKKGRGGRRYLPYVFTEQGVAMLSGVLNSHRAVQVNIAIMRASSACAKQWHPIGIWRNALTRSKRRTTRVSAPCLTRFAP